MAAVLIKPGAFIASEARPSSNYTNAQIAAIVQRLVAECLPLVDVHHRREPAVRMAGRNHTMLCEEFARPSLAAYLALQGLGQDRPS